MNRLEKYCSENGVRENGIRPHVSNRIMSHWAGMASLDGIRADAMPKILALRERHDTLDAIGGTLDRAEKEVDAHYATAHASKRGKGMADKLTESELSALGYNAEAWKGWE